MLSRHTKRAILGFAFGAAAVALLAASARNYFANQALEQRLAEERAALVPPEPLLVPVKRQTRARERTFAATLAPDRRAAVAAEMSGRVAEVLVEVGDSVEQGDILVRLDSTFARLAVASSQAALAAAEAQMREIERRVREAERLAEAQTIPQTDLEAVRAEAAVQAAEIDRLRSHLREQEERFSRHEIRAPFAGSVNERFVETGDSVNVNEAVVALVDIDPLRVQFHVSDLERDSFAPGTALSLTVDSRPGETFSPAIRSVANAPAPGAGLYLIEANLPNPDQSLAAGSRARVKASLTEFRETLFAPAEAVRFQGEHALVEVWSDEQKPVLREVELGPEIDGAYPVLTGLQEGEILLIR